MGGQTRAIERPVKRSMIAFLRDESAATSIEYAVIATGIACAIIITVQLLGDVVKTEYFEKILAATQTMNNPGTDEAPPQ